MQKSFKVHPELFVSATNLYPVPLKVWYCLLRPSHLPLIVSLGVARVLPTHSFNGESIDTCGFTSGEDPESSTLGRFRIRL